MVLLRRPRRQETGQPWVSGRRIISPAGTLALAALHFHGARYDTRFRLVLYFVLRHAALGARCQSDALNLAQVQRHPLQCGVLQRFNVAAILSSDR